jgi:putative flippase GtrA
VTDVRLTGSPVRGEPVTPGRSLAGSFVRWGITGLLAAGTDLGVLALLHSGAGVGLELATVIGFCCGVAINYTLNHGWSFRSSAAHSRVVVRYAVMVAFNGLSTVLIVAGLHHLGVYYLLAKLVAIAVNATVNFAAARWWVFTHD